MEQAIRKPEKSFPDEVLIDILLRLPVDLLATLRYKSKTWLRLLANNSHLIKLHMERSNPIIIAVDPPSHNNHFTQIYCIEDYTSCKPVTLNPQFQNLGCFAVSGSSHGVLCITKTREYTSCSSQHSDVYLWNPLTNEKLTIQCSPIRSDIPLNSDDCQAVFGFGFLEDATVCKVLRAVYVLDCARSKLLRSHVSIYNVCNASWKDLPDLSTSEIHDICPLDPPATVNESLHWIAARSDDYYDKILCFNLKEETFQVMPSPIVGESVYIDDSFIGNPYVHVRELSGQLCIFGNPPNENLELWVMKEYGVADSWTKLLKIGGSFRHLRPIGVASSGEIILMKDTEKYQQLALYNAETKTVKKASNKILFPRLDFVHNLTQSLVSVKSMQLVESELLD
ncbi:hypothetical protein ACHQM5_027323 [Ranunculus cassubicifolius]